MPELAGLAAGDDRVPGVRPAVVAADEIRVLGEQVDDLALALVAPLGPDDHGRGHAQEYARSARRPPAVLGRRRSSSDRERSLAGCHRAQARDAPDADAVSAPAGREADVGLRAERPLDDVGRPGPASGARRGTHRTGRRSRSRRPRARSPDESSLLPPPHAGARSANLAKRRRNESLTWSVGPFRCFARCTSASPCWSDSSPL